MRECTSKSERRYRKREREREKERERRREEGEEGGGGGRVPVVGIRWFGEESGCDYERERECEDVGAGRWT